jgi:protein TonB
MMTRTLHKPLTMPLLLSLLVHGAGAVLLAHFALEMKTPPLEALTFSVDLNTPQAPTATAQPETATPADTTTANPSPATTASPRPKIETKHKYRQTPKPATAAEQVDPPFLVANHTQEDTAASAPDSQRHQAALRNDVVDYLSKQFRARFVYPHRARRRGWQGRVLVYIEVNRDGQLQRVEVNKSSGYDILDQDAVRTFRGIDRLSPALSARLNTETRFSIPVIYKLTRG